jgi:predicted ester cyclase
VSELNKDVVRGLHAMVNSGDLEHAEDLIAPGAVDHAGLPGIDANGPRGFRAMVGAFRTAFPDLSVSIEDLVAEDDLVVARYRLTGTQLGEFMGIAPTGRAVDIEGVDIVRCESGKAIEHWGFSDMLGLLRQLGVGGNGA